MVKVTAPDVRLPAFLLRIGVYGLSKVIAGEFAAAVGDFGNPHRVPSGHAALRRGGETRKGRCHCIAATPQFGQIRRYCEGAGEADCVGGPSGDDLPRLGLGLDPAGQEQRLCRDPARGPGKRGEIRPGRAILSPLF